MARTDERIANADNRPAAGACPTDANPDASALAKWFAFEIIPHDSSLRAYLRSAFPRVSDLDDVVQESYLRVWRARASQPIHSAKAFLFTVARRLVLDRARHAGHSPIDATDCLENIPPLADDRSAVDDVVKRERLRILASAIADLPSRCREIFVLQKIHRLSRREVAQKLGLSEKTVDVQTTNGMKRCATYLRRHGVRGMFDDAV